MDFINEEDIAFFEIRQETGEIGGFLDGWPAGGLDARAHGLGKDVGERGFAEARRAAEEDVIEGFAALFGGRDRDFQAFLDLGLSGEIGEERRAQRLFQRNIGRRQDIGDYAVSHRRQRMRKASGSDKGKSCCGEATLRGALTADAGGASQASISDVRFTKWKLVLLASLRSRTGSTECRSTRLGKGFGLARLDHGRRLSFH